MDKAGEGKTDLRVVKTRNLIEGAFKRLLETTEYGSITVSAIAREAQVSRKTFYAHYSSIDELLRKMALDEVSRIANEIQPHGELLDIEDWVTEFTRRIMLTLQNNLSLNSNVMRCVPLASILEMLRAPLLEVCLNELGKRGIDMVPESDNYLMFYLGGLSAVYETWQLSGQDEKTLDEVARQIAHITWYGIGETLNNAKPEAAGA